MEAELADSQDNRNPLNSCMNVFKTFIFEAARSLPDLPDGHPCKNIHGHSFKITTVSYTHLRAHATLR